jgi:hypothetical protein
MRYFERNSIRCILTLFAVVALQRVAAAQHSDIFLAGVGGKVAVGAAADLEGDAHFDVTTRLFEGVMVADYGVFVDPADYGRAEPGFFALDDGASDFPPGSGPLATSQPVSLNFPAFSVGGSMDSLFYWDGFGGVNFLPISTSQPGVAMALDANPFVMTDGQGGIHDHAVFELGLGGAGAPVPANGVYLVAPTVSVGEMTTSDPFYMVWLVDELLVDDEAAEELEMALESGDTSALGKDFAFYETAVGYVHDNLVVPEPATGLLALSAVIAGMIATGRRTNGRQGDRS